jgi:hypothetical protein
LAQVVMSANDKSAGAIKVGGGPAAIGTAR